MGQRFKRSAAFYYSLIGALAIAPNLRDLLMNRCQDFKRICTGGLDLGDLLPHFPIKLRQLKLLRVHKSKSRASPQELSGSEHF